MEKFSVQVFVFAVIVEIATMLVFAEREFDLLFWVPPLLLVAPVSVVVSRLRDKRRTLSYGDFVLRGIVAVAVSLVAVYVTIGLTIVLGLSGWLEWLG